jgi:predicted phage terminase large subunit-like protein
MSKARGKEKSFLDELAAFAQEQRDLIHADCNGFATDEASRTQRRAQAASNFEHFARSYFPHYIKGDASVFHTWFYNTIPGLIDDPRGHLVIFSAPRGEAKSTLATQLFTIWCIVTERKHFVPIVMDAFDQAATMLEAIKVELEENPRLKLDFPAQTGAGRVWNVGVILTANDIKIQAFGSGKRMRGLRHGPYRPDLVILDDIENDENVDNKDQRDKKEAWLQKVVLNLGPPDGAMDVLYPNTILHYDSVANRTHRKPRWVRKKFKAIIRWPDRMDLWEQWEDLFINAETDDEAAGQAAERFYLDHQVEMEAGAIVSWPSVRPLLALMKIRAEDHHAFACEYQNEPTNADAQFFRDLGYWVQPQRDWLYLGAHDPSLGKRNKKRDPSAMLVGGLDRRTGVLDIVEAKIVRILPHKQIENIIAAQREYQCQQWAFEAVQFQEFMRDQLVKESARQGIPVPATPVIPSTDKEMRIESLSPHVRNQLIRSHRTLTELNEQLLNYPEAAHDDGPDALEMLWKLAVARMGGVMKIRMGRRRNTIPLPETTG